MNKVYFHGNNKTIDELEMALAGVYDPLRDLYSDYLSVQLSQATDEVFSKESAPIAVVYISETFQS